MSRTSELYRAIRERDLLDEVKREPLDTHIRILHLRDFNQVNKQP